MARASILALILIVGCSTGPRRGAQRGLRPVDLTMVKELVDTFKQYVAALLLLNNPEPADWERGYRELDVIEPYLVAADERTDPKFPAEIGLIEKARTGDSAARLELGRRGQIYDALTIYWKPYNGPAWDAARTSIERLSIDGDGTSYLAHALLMMLLNGQLRQLWPQVRSQLFSIGDPARELIEAVAQEKVKVTPQTVIYREDDLVQLFAVVLQFGERSEKTIKGWLVHPNHNVRKAMARAIGDVKDVRYLPELDRLLRERTTPESWIVRAAAAEACTNLESARKLAGPMLLNALQEEASHKEDSAFRSVVIIRIYRAISAVHYVDAIPELIKDLDVPNRDWALEVMSALYHITTKKELLTPQEWKRWFKDDYAKWRADWRKQHNE